MAPNLAPSTEQSAPGLPPAAEAAQEPAKPPVPTWSGWAWCERNEKGRKIARVVKRRLVGIEARCLDAARQEALKGLRELFPANRGWRITLASSVDQPEETPIPLAA